VQSALFLEFYEKLHSHQKYQPELRIISLQRMRCCSDAVTNKRTNRPQKQESLSFGAHTGWRLAHALASQQKQDRASSIRSESVHNIKKSNAEALPPSKLEVQRGTVPSACQTVRIQLYCVSVLCVSWAIVRTHSSGSCRSKHPEHWTSSLASFIQLRECLFVLVCVPHERGLGPQAFLRPRHQATEVQ
jgi:hypothetical protein